MRSLAQQTEAISAWKVFELTLLPTYLYVQSNTLVPMAAGSASLPSWMLRVRAPSPAPRHPTRTSVYEPNGGITASAIAPAVFLRATAPRARCRAWRRSGCARGAICCSLSDASALGRCAHPAAAAEDAFAPMTGASRPFRDIACVYWPHDRATLTPR